MGRPSLSLFLGIKVLVLLISTARIDGQCYTDLLPVPLFPFTVLHSSNETFDSPTTCQFECLELKYAYAAVGEATTCFCGTTNAGLATSTSCTSLCLDGQPCGGATAGIISVYSTSGMPSLTGNISFSLSPLSVGIGVAVTATVSATPSNFTIDWGDGSTPVLNALTHTYPLPGNYTVKAALLSPAVGVESEMVTVHEGPSIVVTCPTFLTLGVAQSCNTTSLRQGYDYNFTWYLANASATQEFSTTLPAEIDAVYGFDSVSTDVLTAGSLVTGSLAVISPAVSGGYIVRVRANVATAGTLAIYSITPQCTTNAFCGVTNTCSASTCATGAPLSCSAPSSFCSLGTCIDTCATRTSPSSSAYSFKLLTTVAATAGAFLFDLPVPVWINEGTYLAVGCDSVASCAGSPASINGRPLGTSETNDNLRTLNTAALSMSVGGSVPLVQVVIRADPLVYLNLTLLCEAVAPVPNALVPVPYTAATEQYVHQGNLSFYLSLNSATINTPQVTQQSILCQQNISAPTLIPEIFMPYGVPYPLTVTFTQGSPLFSAVNIDTTVFYSYQDNAYPSWVMDLSLVYAQEGLYTMTGNTSNVLGFVLYQSIIHVIPVVTSTWTLTITCPCLDIDLGFPFELDFPSAPHPPWNATLTYSYDLGALFPQEIFDFATYGKLGVAAPLKIPKTAIVLTAGNYTVKVFMWNEVSNNTIFKDFSVVPAIRDVNAHLIWNNSGVIMDGMGANENIFMTNFTVFFYPYCRTGVPDKWRITINETAGGLFQLETVDVTGNFTHTFGQDNTYSITISGYNSVQGWVDSPPIIIRTVFNIQGFMLTDDGVITEPGANKNLLGNFLIFTPMACILIYYGDESPTETFGYQPLCNKTYPNAIYKGSQLIAPVIMPHVYNNTGMYDVMAIAFDDKVTFQQTLSVVIGYIPCTMPIVTIAGSVKLLDAIPTYRKSLPILLQTNTSFACNVSVVATKWWTLAQIDPITTSTLGDVTIEKVLSTWNASQLAIPALFLPYGTYVCTYYFSLNISKDFQLTRHDFTYFTVIQSPLMPVIISGSVSTLKRGFGQILLMNPGSLSLDPDDPTDRNLTFKWWCQQTVPNGPTLQTTPDGNYIVTNVQAWPAATDPQNRTGGGCFGLENGALSVGLPRIYFNTAFFINPIATYQFILEVDKGNRSATTSLKIQLVIDPPPSIQIGCAPAMCVPSGNVLIINPTKTVAFNGSCIADCTTIMSYYWSMQTDGGLPVDESSMFCSSTSAGGAMVISTAPTNCTPTFLTTRNSTDIAISPVFFTNNKNIDSFIFRLTGTTSTAMDGFSEIIIKVNKPPTGGSCVLSTPIGDALISVYPTTCSNWVDPENLGIQSYTFWYYDTTPTGTYRKTLASTTQPTIDLILPVGNFSVFVDIADPMNAFTTWSLGNVTGSMPSQENVTAFNTDKVIAYLASIGDQTSLGMLLVAMSSVKDNSDWLALDPTSLANLTQAEIMARIAAIANMNDNQLKSALNNMNFNSLGQLNVGGDILQSSLAGVFQGIYGAYTVDMSTRNNALALLQKMTNSIPSLGLSDPNDLKPFMSDAMDGMSSIIKGINVITSQTALVPPTDMLAAGTMDYDTDIGDDLNMEIPTDQSTMFQKNVLSTTKTDSQAQINQIFNIVDQIACQVYSMCVDGQTIVANSPNGASIIVSKINEYVLDNGLTISAGANENAKIHFPVHFCPSHYVISFTDCRKELGLIATVWPTITHLFPDTSQVLSNTTKVIDVYVNISMSRVNVLNETLPIILEIPRDAQSLPTPLYVNATQITDQTIIYHHFNVSNTDSAYTIEITPMGTLPRGMILLIDHARMPTLGKYLKLVQISSLKPNENGTYSLFVSSNENANKSGRFFGGIAILKNGITLSPTTQLSSSMLETTFPCDYTFRVFLSGCYYFDNTDVAWKGAGVSVMKASPYTVSCASIHLTPFGSGFLPQPNFIDFSYIFTHAGFIDNSTIYAVLIVLIVWYIIMMIWAHFMDKKDLKKRGVIPLPDNKVIDKYLYEVTFATGPDKEATTDSKLYFIASGDFGETEVRFLPPADNHLYRRFAVNSFVMAVPRPLGHINFLRVFHDNNGEPPLDSWQLESVVFRDLQTNEKSIFDVNSWLSLDRDDGMIDKTFISLEGADEKSFSQNMYVRGNRAANQDHMWMGIFLRPAGSRFCRKERVSVCATFLFLSMLASALWYNQSPDSTLTGYFNFGPFTMSSEQLIIGACILLIVYPFVYALCLVFKRARPRKLKRCRALDSIETQKEAQLLQEGLKPEEAISKSKVEVNEGKSPRIKQKSPIKCIPWWTRVIAWGLIIVCLIGSTFLVWSYGIMWGNIKTIKWFSSFILCFLISIVVTQWIKVLIQTLVASSVCKTDLTAEDVDCDEELPALKHNEEWDNVKFLDQGMRKKVNRVEGVDMENPEIATLRIRRMKEREMGSVVRGILAYCAFLAIIYILMSGRTDYNAFLIQDHFKNIMIKPGDKDYDFSQGVQTTGDWWNWAQNVILQELRAQRDYNDATPYGLRGFMNDRVSRMLGYAIIRQVRSKRLGCATPSPMNQTIKHCSGARADVAEESNDFCAGWQLNESFSGACRWNEYKYQTAEKLETYTTTGKLGYYSGGGYVFRLSGSQENLLARMTRLQENFWVDQNTRAIFLEFSIYNTNVNLFSTCSIVAEFTEGGGITPSWRFEPVKLIKDTGVKGIITTVAEVLFVAATFFFTFRELWLIKQLKCEYFQSNWNLAEIILIIISYAVIGLYFYRAVLTQVAIDVFDKTNGNGYVRMDSAVYIDQCFLYCMGTIIFFSTLKLIKLLQFNKRMNVLALTIKKCWDELKIFLVAFAIIFFAFTCVFFFMFTSSVLDFSEIVSSVLCSFKMMLGKFDFGEMNAVNPFSPFLFFIFSLINSMILINIMLTIILCAFNEVKKEIEHLDNRLNVIDYVWSSFRQFIRSENLHRIHVEPKLTDKKDDYMYPSELKERESDQLPDKVSQLVRYINDFYFDGRLDMNDAESKKALMGGNLPNSKPSFRDPNKIGKRNVLLSDI